MRLWKKSGSHPRSKMTYRTRRRLHRIGVFCGYFFGIALFVWLCWLLWLNRFVVYSGSEAKLDFTWESHLDDAVVALPPTDPTVAIRYNEGEDTVHAVTEITKLSGYYVTYDDLVQGVAPISEAIKQLPDGTAVMLELKDPYGTFYYSTKTADSVITGQLDPAAVDALIKTLTTSGCYAIAKVPAFRDQNYGLENAPYGSVLPHSSGGYMWADADNCYWMDPSNSDALSYVISIAKELYSLGFDEVVFTDFAFPPTDDILFDGDRSAVITKAAQEIAAACPYSNYTVSFAAGSVDFPLPADRSRLYLTGVDPTDLKATAERFTIADSQTRLVFLTDTNDTRFDAYSAIRPMMAADAYLPQA